MHQGLPQQCKCSCRSQGQSNEFKAWCSNQQGLQRCVMRTHTSCFLRCWRASRAVIMRRSGSTTSCMHVCISNSVRASNWSRLAAAGLSLDAARSSRIAACRRSPSVHRASESVSVQRKRLTIGWNFSQLVIKHRNNQCKHAARQPASRLAPVIDGERQ